MQMKRSWGKHLFLTILSSYIVMLIATLGLNLFFYRQAYRRVEENTLENQQHMLSQAANALERIVGDASNAGKQILASQQTQSLLFCRAEDLNAYKKMSIMRLQDELIRRIAYNNSVQEIWVSFRRSGVAATNMGMRRTEELEREWSERFGLTKDVMTRAYAARSTLIPAGKGGAMLVLVYDSVMRGMPDAVCHLLLDSAAVRDVLKATVDPDSVRIWLASLEGRAVAAPGTPALPKDIYARLSGGEALVSSLEGGAQQFIAAPLSLPGWQLIAAVDMDSYRKPLRRLQRNYLAITALCLVVGGMLAVWFSHWRVKRIGRITRHFIATSGIQAEQRDELAVLEEGMQRILTENERYREDIEHHLREIRNDWLLRVMRGRVHTEEAFRQGCEDYQMGFDGPAYAVIALDITGYTYAEKPPGDTGEDVFDMINYCVDSFTAEFLARRYRSHSCSYDGILFSVINLESGAMPEEDALAQEKQALRDFCASLVAYVEKRVGVSLRCYLSCIEAGLAGIGRAYAETREGLRRLETYNITDEVNDRESVEAVMPRTEPQEDEPKERQLSGQAAQICAFIDENYQDCMLTVAEIADHFHISQSYLLRIFKKNLGVGVLEYISQRRVEEAKRLLKETKDTVSVIAERVGYANSLALIRAFRKLENLTPTEYRRLF